MTERRPVIGYGQPKRPGRERTVPTADNQPLRAPEGTPDDEPVEAIVRLNVACNQHCFFCNTDARAENLYEDPKAVRKYIRENQNALYLSFSGGEPTINPHILGHVAYAKSLGVERIIVQTNAMMSSYAPFADKLVDAGLTGAFVSLHAPDAETSDKITATPGSWQLTVKGLRNLLDRGVECEINTVINPMNLDRLGDHARFIVANFPDAVAVSLSVVAPTGFCPATPRTIPSITALQPHLFEALDVLDAAGICAKIPDRCGIPLCTVRGYEKHHEALMFSPFAGHGRVSQDRTKFDGCDRCTWNDRCIGYWKDAVEIHGTAPFVPVTEVLDVKAQPLPYKGATPELVQRFLDAEARRLAGRNAGK